MAGVLILTALTALAAAAAPRSRIRQPPLQRAVQVTTLDAEDQYLWLSNDALLLFRRTRKNPNDRGWHISQFDLRSRKETSLAPLTALFNASHGEISSEVSTLGSVSPDGRRLLWLGYEAPTEAGKRPGSDKSAAPAARRPAAEIASLDGSQHTWHAIGSEAYADGRKPHPIFWATDSKSWLEATPVGVIARTVEGDHPRPLRLPAGSGSWDLDAPIACSAGRFIPYRYQRGVLRADEYRITDQISRPTVHQVQVDSTNLSAAELALSAARERLAVATLRVSGEALWQIAFQPDRVRPFGMLRTVPFGGVKLQWSPDGKRLGLASRGYLWRVDVP